MQQASTETVYSDDNNGIITRKDIDNLMIEKHIR